MENNSVDGEPETLSTTDEPRNEADGRLESDHDHDQDQDQDQASVKGVPGEEQQDDVKLFGRKNFVLLLLGLVVAYPVVTFFDVWLASTQTNDVSGDAAIVLGAAQYNGEPSPVLSGRLDRAAELFDSGSVALIVVTGGAQEGDVGTEANAGYVYLRREAGLADEDIRLEVQGESTYESLAATARFLETEDVTNVVVVTDPFHARRAALVAEEVGLTVEVALTSNPATFGRLVEETAAVSIGRIIGFRRLQQLL